MQLWMFLLILQEEKPAPGRVTRQSSMRVEWMVQTVHSRALGFTEFEDTVVLASSDKGKKVYVLFQQWKTLLLTHLLPGLGLTESVLDKLAEKVPEVSTSSDKQLMDKLKSVGAVGARASKARLLLLSQVSAILRDLAQKGKYNQATQPLIDCALQIDNCGIGPAWAAGEEVMLEPDDADHEATALEACAALSRRNKEIAEERNAGSMYTGSRPELFYTNINFIRRTTAIPEVCALPVRFRSCSSIGTVDMEMLRDTSLHTELVDLEKFLKDPDTLKKGGAIRSTDTAYRGLVRHFMCFCMMVGEKFVPEQCFSLLLFTNCELVVNFIGFSLSREVSHKTVSGYCHRMSVLLQYIGMRDADGDKTKVSIPY